MNVFRDPVTAITASDIEQLCTAGASENVELELKADLPTKFGKRDEWHNGGSFGDFARNRIAEEIVAFANTLGGVLLLGIEETTDHPHRAAKPNPSPRVHELAPRRRQAVHDIVDPPLPLLEAEGIASEGGSGVVLMRVAASRRKPHRHRVNLEVFIRRADESVKIGMREIQELTIRSAADATRTCGRRPGKDCLTFLQHWSGAVTCPACWCGKRGRWP
jgi:predicted HTH transcriptional regulator